MAPDREAEAAKALVAVAPLTSRWIERLLAGHEPALTTPQYLAMRSIDREPVSVNELARRAGRLRPGRLAAAQHARRARACSPGGRRTTTAAVRSLR